MSQTNYFASPAAAHPQRSRFWPLSVLLMLLLAALGNAEDGANDKAGAASYKLGPGDEILVKVYGEDDLSIRVILGETGSFNYPFLGEIKAEGLTEVELEQLITKGLKGPYLLNPEVTVLIEEFRPFYLSGEIERPGGYPYRPGLTLAKAISLAGGFTDRASRRKIVALRPGANGKETATIGLDDPVYPGDIITVKRSFF